MAHLSINASELSDRSALRRRLRDQLAQLPSGAPIIIMTHGFRYCPSDQQNDPHKLILSPVEREGLHSWPRALDLDEGLTIGFGWTARGDIWQAYQASQAAGIDLAQLISELRDLSPNPIHMVGHSLGARVILHALANADAGSIGRAILISPAVLQSEACILAKTSGARHTEIISVVSNQNTVFDVLLRAALAAGPMLGRGGPERANWLDIKLGDARTEEQLAALGYWLAPDNKMVCHWSGYRRAGIWALYRNLLCRPDLLRLEQIRVAPDTPQARPVFARA